MKILRAHHGFTTNSSSAAEWVTNLPGVPLSEFNAQGNVADSNVLISVTNQPTEEPQPSAKVASDNLIMLGGFVCTILGIFAVERIIRKKISAKRQAEAE